MVPGYIAGLSILVFVASYTFITLEHKLKTNKSAIALTCAGILWLLSALSNTNEEHFKHSLVTAGNEVFGLIVFLLCAMTLVEVMVHLKLFDYLQTKIDVMGLTYIQQFWITSILTFFLSAFLDNLTVTIIMIQIAKNFYKGKSIIPVAAGIVIAANSGGAWSPVGDITTIMLWLAEKFTAAEVVIYTIIPSIVLNLIATYMISKHISKEDFVEEYTRERVTGLPRNNVIIVAAAFLSFTFPIFMNIVGLPPYLGLAFGLGIVWTLFELLHNKGNNHSHEETHLEVKIENLLQKTDISSLKFFIGILLSVAALESMGILETISHFVFGQDPTFTKLVYGNIFMGLFSAIVDNVPLAALSINMLEITDPILWTLTALSVGTGGSSLVIGSAAGVIAMGMVKELTFDNYLKVAAIPALVGFFAAIGVWLIQYYLFVI